MPKTLTDVKNALEKLDGGKDLFEVVAAIKKEADSIPDLKSSASSAKKGYDSLQTTHNKMVSGLKELGYESGDVPEFISGVKVKLDKAAEIETVAEEGKGQNKQLLSQMKSLEKKFETADAEAKREKTLRRQGVIREVLTSKFQNRIYGLGAHVTSIINSELVELGDDEKTVYFKKNGARTDVDTGVTEYLEAHKDDQRNDQNGGTGGGNQGAGESGGKVKSRADYENMSVDERNAHVKEGGTFKD
jgi:hypothetical protein